MKNEGSQPAAAPPADQRTPEKGADEKRLETNDDPSSFRIDAGKNDADRSASDFEAPEYYAKDARPKIDPDPTGRSPKPT